MANAIATGVGKVVGQGSAIVGEELGKDFAKAMGTLQQLVSGLGSFSAGVGEGATGNPVSMADTQRGEKELKSNQATLAKRQESGDTSSANVEPELHFAKVMQETYGLVGAGAIAKGAEPEEMAQLFAQAATAIKALKGIVTPANGANVPPQEMPNTSATEAPGTANIPSGSTNYPAKGLPSENGNLGYEERGATSPFAFGGAKIENGKLVTQDAGVIGNLLQTLMGAPNLGQRMALNKLQQVQTMTGEEPQQKGARQQAETELLMKKRAAAETPLTKEQEVTAQAAVNVAKTEKENKELQRMDDTIKGLLDQRKEIWERSNFVGKGAKIKAIDEQLAKWQDVRQKKMMRASGRPVINKAETSAEHTASQIEIYNKARSAGLSKEEAKKKAGL